MSTLCVKIAIVLGLLIVFVSSPSYRMIREGMDPNAMAMQVGQNTQCCSDINKRLSTYGPQLQKLSTLPLLETKVADLQEAVAELGNQYELPAEE